MRLIDWRNVEVSTEGKVIFTHIIEGRANLNLTAIAARSWTFEPATLDSQPVQVSGVISFDSKPSAPKPNPPAAKTTTKDRVAEMMMTQVRRWLGQ